MVYAPNSLILLMIAKVLRIIFTYVSLMIAKNYTTQIYMDKVLVKNENPPLLSNMVYLYLAIEMIMMAVFLALMFGVMYIFEIRSDAINSYILPDYFIATIVNVIIGRIVASQMYKKKYFLYKDDGLRAIRALSELLLSLAIVQASVPWNSLMNGFLADIYKNVSAFSGRTQP
jgi:hypothetical protein